MGFVTDLASYGAGIVGGAVGGVSGLVSGDNVLESAKSGWNSGKDFANGVSNSIEGGPGGSDSPDGGANGAEDPQGSSQDYSDVLSYMSDNNKTIALAQIAQQEAAMQQASIDRQLQVAANLELGLEKLDVKLEMSKMDFYQQMTAEQNSFQENLANITRGNPGAMELPSSDLPPPSDSFV